MRPLSARLRKQIRQIPNLRYTARGRPQMRQRDSWRDEYFGVLSALAIFDLLATGLTLPFRLSLRQFIRRLFNYKLTTQKANNTAHPLPSSTKSSTSPNLQYEMAYQSHEATRVIHRLNLWSNKKQYSFPEHEHIYRDSIPEKPTAR